MLFLTYEVGYHLAYDVAYGGTQVGGLLGRDTVDAAKAFNVVGLFGNQNTVCQPRVANWRHTVERLKAVCELEPPPFKVD